MEQEIDVLRSVHGPILNQKGNKAVALRIPGKDRPNAALQWWNMGRAKNLMEFENAMKNLQIPMFNTILCG